MRKSSKLTWSMKFFFIVLVGLQGISLSGVAHADWSFGIGTGIFLMHAEGDQGFNVAVLDLPVEFEVDLDPEDFSDLMETAFGLGGFATDGKWMIQFSGGVLKLEADPSRTIAGVGTVSGKLGWDKIQAGFSYNKRHRFNSNVIIGAGDSDYVWKLQLHWKEPQVASSVQDFIGLATVV